MSKDDYRQNKAPLQHLAVIMDGNGRWAQKRGLARSAGHRYGAEKLYDLCAKLHDSLCFFNRKLAAAGSGD